MYAYCANNPVYYVDPSGYACDPLSKNAPEKAVTTELAIHDPNFASEQRMWAGEIYFDPRTNRWKEVGSNKFVATPSSLVRSPQRGSKASTTSGIEAMEMGRKLESTQLATQGLQDTKYYFELTPDQVQSAAFHIIVGEPQYTPTGKLRGTIFDASKPNAFIEIKNGSSVLNSTYQIRLQVYASLVEGRQYILQSNRPLSPSLLYYSVGRKG